MVANHRRICGNTLHRRVHLILTALDREIEIQFKQRSVGLRSKTEATGARFAET